MTAFPSYSTGTVAIGSGATTVVGTGSNWSGQNAIPGDLLVVAGNSVIVQDVTDALHLAIDAWPFAAVTAGAAYKLYKVSPLRFAGGQAMAAVDTLVAALNTSGFYVFVGPTETVPDPSLGDDEQYALQANTGKLWQKTGGTWNFIGTQKGFSLKGLWSSATAYLAFDVVSLDGTSYVCILANTNQMPSFGDSPPNPYWNVLAEKGEAATISVGAVTTGVGGSAAAVSNSGTEGDAVLDFTIPRGIGYGGTSATSLAIANTVTRVFTTQAGLGYNGTRVRAASAANPINYMEGTCTYSGTTLTMTVDAIGGSGTKTDWVFSIAGQPGAAGGGALLASNNLADVANAATALANLGGQSASAALTLSNAQQIQNALSIIYQSKTLSSYRRLINSFFDGYKNTDGVDASSANTTPNTGTGFVGPSPAFNRVTGGTASAGPTLPLTGSVANINDNNPATSVSWTASGTLVGAGTSTRILGRIDFGSNQTITKIEAVGFSQTAGAAGYAFFYSVDNTNWTQLGSAIAGSSSPTTSANTGSVTARYIALVMAAADFTGVSVTLQDLNGYTSGISNMSLVTTFQTADASVSNGLVVLEYDNTASLTLNTDITAEVTCDGGAHWTAATLSLVSSHSQGGRSVAKTVDQATTAGTSFAARIKTLTNKSAPIYGVGVFVH